MGRAGVSVGLKIFRSSSMLFWQEMLAFLLWERSHTEAMCSCNISNLAITAASNRCWGNGVIHINLHRTSWSLTWSLTLAVSKGKVMRSAMQAAVPAPINFTAAVGGTSAGPKPTILSASKRTGMYSWGGMKDVLKPRSENKIGELYPNLRGAVEEREERVVSM